MDSSTSSAARLIRLNTRPWPSRESRVNGFQQRSTSTSVTVSQARLEGNPGYFEIRARKLSGGCPAGIHQGIIGATEVTRTNVSSLRVIQPLILCSVCRAGRELRQMK